MKIKVAQINSVVGNFKFNASKMLDILNKSSADELVIFPECALCGYPAQDLLEYPAFTQSCEMAVEELVRSAGNKNYVFGSIAFNKAHGKPLLNIAVVVIQGKIVGTYSKRLLPTYDVFDEDRFFEPGNTPFIFEFQNKKIGLSICEDIWSDDSSLVLHNRYAKFPLQDYSGVDIFVNLSASPFEASKVDSKFKMLSEIAARYKKPLVYVNSVGANDSLIFDGRSYVFSSSGDLLFKAAGFVERIESVDLSRLQITLVRESSKISDIYDALVLGIKDYCKKKNFTSVTLGLSGGIDSSVVACLAVDALGVENVIGVLMPSRFTSVESNRDALVLAKNLQNPIHILAIEDMFNSALRTLEKTFEGIDQDVTEENIQSRIRGLLLMALSNKFGCLTLTTGNKSELAVGYCTLYGDMCGALAPLADVYKTQVFELGREANRRGERIPESVFTKAPTAELRPNQTDQDSLPPYETLDAILLLLLEKAKSPEEVKSLGFDSETVNQIRKMLVSSEHKRWQMPLGFKVSSKAFGVGRRIPLVHDFFNA